MDEKSYSAIENGHRVKLDGQGFMHEEDGTVADHWLFNEKPGEIYFRLDNGAQFNCQDGPWIENARRAAALARSASERIVEETHASS
jgi:hypothetical protein